MHATALPAVVEPLRRPTAVLTPRGTVAALIVRLEYQLAELTSEDRAYCLDLVRELIEEVTA
jgi:hypothetical protein